MTIHEQAFDTFLPDDMDVRGVLPVTRVSHLYDQDQEFEIWEPQSVPMQPNYYTPVQGRLISCWNANTALCKLETGSVNSAYELQSDHNLPDDGTFIHSQHREVGDLSMVGSDEAEATARDLDASTSGASAAQLSGRDDEGTASLPHAPYAVGVCNDCSAFAIVRLSLCQTTINPHEKSSVRIK